jgi:hypothetical protein
MFLNELKGMEDYNNLIETLGAEEKKSLRSLYETKLKALQQVWIDEIEIDAKHLELVNVCYNLFTKTTEINHKTGYRIVLVDTLVTLGIKIFDLLLYNENNKIAILLDAKSSISERGVNGTVDDTSKASLEAIANKDKIELFIGNTISKMEFVLVTPAFYAEALRDAVVSKNANICVWGYYHEPGRVQLLQPTDEEVPIQRLNGRTHNDETLRQVLLKSVPAKMGGIRSLPIMPTSHIFTKFEYLSQHLYVLLDRLPKEKRWFGYSAVFNLLKQAYSPTEFDDSQIEQETKKVINSALNARLFRRINSEEDIVESEFVINYKRSTYEKFRQEYLDNRPSDKVYAETVNEFRRIKGIKSLPDFWRKP